MGVEEKAVRTPGEGLVAPVEVGVCGGLREMTVVLVDEMLHMLSMIILSVANPENTGHDCERRDLGYDGRQGR